MKKFKFSAIILLLHCLAMAQTNAGHIFTLRVKVAQANKNTQLFLAYQVNGKKILDSATLANGLYTLTGAIEQPLNATLIADNQGLGSRQLIITSKKGGSIDALQFYIHPGIINLTADKQLHKAAFTGSAINVDNERLKALLKPINDQQMIISAQLRTGGYVISANEATAARKPLPADTLKVRRLAKQLDSLAGATRPLIKHFVERNPDSYIALLQLQAYGGSFPDVQAIEPMFNRLSAAVRNTGAGKDYAKVLWNRKNMVPGTVAPPFTQNDTLGKLVSLAAFKGKYVLLDFWASWCGPCRANNPELVQIFNDFKDKNFTILGISLDEVDGKSAWLKAIKDDHLSWTQVSDLRHWDNSAAKLYSVRAIPQNFLIGPDGTIVAKGLNSSQLRKKLEEILAK